MYGMRRGSARLAWMLLKVLRICSAVSRQLLAESSSWSTPSWVCAFPGDGRGTSIVKTCQMSFSWMYKVGCASSGIVIHGKAIHDPTLTVSVYAHASTVCLTRCSAAREDGEVVDAHLAWWLIACPPQKLCPTNRGRIRGHESASCTLFSGLLQLFEVTGVSPPVRRRSTKIKALLFSKVTCIVHKRFKLGGTSIHSRFQAPWFHDKQPH